MAVATGSSRSGLRRDGVAYRPGQGRCDHLISGWFDRSGEGVL